MAAFARWWRPVVLLGLGVGLGAAACPKNDATGPTVTSVVITPSAVSLHPGQQATFYTYARKSNGDSVAATVTYSATGGLINSGGVFTAGATAGSYQAIAKLASGTMADTASITIDSVPPAPVATVTVTPAHPSIAAGTTVSLTATTKDSNGTVLTGRVVTWTSGTGSVGTVDLNGVVTGVSAGTTIITATSEGKQGKDTVTVTTPVATLVRINLTPDSVALDTGHTQQFTVTGKFSDSTTATVPATFSATGGSVNSSGLYKAGTTAGSFHVIAVAAGGLTDTSKVTVSLPTLVRVVLTPDSALVDTGHTQQFSVSGKFSDSSTASITVNYSATGGSISAGGLYTAGTTAGTYQVIAVKTGGSLADTSKVVVVANATSAAECATPQAGWIFCDDFEQDRSSLYFETDGIGTVFNRVAGVGKDGSYGMQGHFTVGAQSAGDLHLAFGKTPSSYFKSGTGDSTTIYREIYWRMYVKAQAGWVGAAHDKLTRALVFGSSNFAEAAAAHIWGGDIGSADTMGLILDPASGVDASGNLVSTGYNSGLTYLGQAKHSPHPTPIFDAAHVGQWYCVEAHVKLNTSGASDGIFEMWINDSLEAQKTGMNWVSSYSAFGINAIYFENYWNAGAPVAEDRFFDNIVVSTQRIGC